MWPAIKIPVILVAIIAAIVLILVLLRRSNNAHAQKVEAHARSNGWTYSRKDDQGLDTQIETILPGERFFVYNVRQVRADKPRVLLFDCEHRERANQRNSSSSTGCLVEFSHRDPARATTEIIPLNILDKHLLPNVIDLHDEVFGEAFNVLGSDSMTANRVVTPTVRRLLLEDWKRNTTEPIRVVIRSGEVLFLSGSRNLIDDGGRLTSLVDLTRAIASAIESGAK